MVSCPECLTPVVGNVLGRKGWTKLPEHFLKLPQRARGVFRPFDVANQMGPCLTRTWHWPFKQVVSIYWTSVVFNMGMTGLFTRRGKYSTWYEKNNTEKERRINNGGFIAEKISFIKAEMGLFFFLKGFALPVWCCWIQNFTPSCI